MSKQYKISQLIMNDEKVYNNYDEELNNFKKVREVKNGENVRYLTWVDENNIERITTPEGRELTIEELFDFIIGENITDLARTRKSEDNKADIAIVLGNSNLLETRERAIKAFELYRLGIVKKIIFTGGIQVARDKKGYMHPTSVDEYMNNEEINQDWQDLPEADWGAETFIPDVFDEDYKKHSLVLTEDFLNSIGVNPEDILTESLSKSTQENAEFCRNIFDSEEIETGLKINSAVVVTTCTHGSRAMRQFKKVFGDKISLRWCPSTLDLEKHESLRRILRALEFDEEAFKKELKRIYCTTPELAKKLIIETGNHRNAFILGDIDEPYISTKDEEIIEKDNDVQEI